MKGKIAYRFETPTYPADIETPIYPEDILYVNLVANYSCINDCLFCSRPRTLSDIGKPNIYERKADSFLYLPKPPSLEKVMQAIDKEIKDDDVELAIVGLGESLIYLPKVVEVIRRVNEKYDIKTIVDTNGLVKCMYKNPTQRLEEAGLDEIRISLNAINKKEYNQLCRPKFGNVFPNLISFVQECINSKINTYVSFVIGFDREGVRKRTEKEYGDFVLSLGMKPEKIIFRDYVYV